MLATGSLSQGALVSIPTSTAPLTPIAGTLNVALGDATLTSTATVALKAALSATLDNVALAAACALAIAASASVTLDDISTVITSHFEAPGSGKRKNFPSYIPQPAYEVRKRPPVQPIWDQRRRKAAEDELARERAATRFPVLMPPTNIFATPQQVSYPQPTKFAPHQVQRIAQQSGDARDIADIQGIADMQSRDASDMQDVSDIMQLIKGIE